MRRVILALVLIIVVQAAAVRAQQTDVVSQKPAPIKVFEIDRASNWAIVKQFELHRNILDCNAPELYIINYGSDREIRRREKAITRSQLPRCFDRSRITLVRGGMGKGPLTIVWQIPPGADNPAP